MAVLLAAVVAGEEDVEAGDVDEKHGCAEDVAGRVRREADAGDGVRGVEVDGLDLGEGAEVVLLGVKDVAQVGGRGRVADAHRVLDQPAVDGFGGVGHEDAAFERGFAEDVWEGGDVVEVETGEVLLVRIGVAVAGKNIEW